ncbi:hypothetical protein F4860DRAFT_508962 [Xylaria cubensis]|nr:hypothetical protein F4860DRAFT_508962 [Xylaria cubensis]
MPFDKLPAYWYDTGPHNIFSTAVDVRISKDTPTINKVENNNKKERSGPQGTSESFPAETAPYIHPLKTLLLLKRGGEGNPWYCLIETFLTFVTHRVLDFYEVKSPLPRAQGQSIVVTFVWRREHRRLKNENAQFAELGRRNPHISERMIDFAALPFAAQVCVA